MSSNTAMCVFGFAAQLFVARILSAADLGRIKTLQSFGSVAVILAGCGLNTAVLKLCSEPRPDGEKERILKTGVVYTLVASACTVAGLSVCALLGWVSPDPLINRWMLCYLFYIPATALSLLFIAYLQALKKFRLVSYAQVLIRMAGMGFIVLLSWLFGLRGFIGATVTVGFLAVLPLVRFSEFDWNIRGVSGALARTSLRYGAWSAGSYAVNTLNFSLDMFLLNYLVADRTLLGDYGLATVFVMGLNQITGTVQIIATTYFSEKSRDRAEFRRVLMKYQFLLTVLSGLIAITASYVIPWFISAVYSAKYRIAPVFFQVLVLRYFFWSCYALVNGALIGLGRMKNNFIASLINLPITFGLTWYFVRRCGAVGAAYGQIVAAMCACLVVWINFAVVWRCGDPARFHSLRRSSGAGNEVPAGTPTAADGAIIKSAA